MEKAANSDPLSPEYPVTSYAPSVPISLYREVTAELQGSKGIIDSLKDQNKQLLQQNQQLRQELENVTQAAIKLQQAVNSAQKLNQPVNQPNSLLARSPLPLPVSAIPSSPPALKLSMPQETPQAASPALLSSPQQVQPEVRVPINSAQPELPFPSPDAKPPELIETLYTEEPERPIRLTNSKRSSQTELSGFWLAVSIGLIVIFAFGAGYWIVRPLIKQR
ncbi:MAG: hypothetical protein ACRC8A_16070 [Microcoleaceae cyanobacterium]